MSGKTRKSRKRTARIVVFSASPLALEVAEKLAQQGYEFVVVDDDEAALDEARERGLNVVHADYTEDEALEALGIGAGVEIIFSLFPEEAVNVFLCISARAMAPGLRIVSVLESGGDAARLHAAGADAVIDPSEIGGRKVYGLVHNPLVVELIEAVLLGPDNLFIEEIAIPAGSSLDGFECRELAFQQDYQVVVVGIVNREGEPLFLFSNEVKSHRLASGERVVVMGPAPVIDRLRADLAAESRAASS